MIIETKFSNGDRVWHISRRTQEVRVTCKFCNGLGKIFGADNSDEHCPKCWDKGYNVEWQSQRWRVNGKLTIGQVRVEISKSEGVETYPVQFDNFSPKDSRDEKYMCEETGIGSGSLYNSNDLFSTEEEAMAQCDKRNMEVL